MTAFLCPDRINPARDGISTWRIRGRICYVPVSWCASGVMR